MKVKCLISIACYISVAEASSSYGISSRLLQTPWDYSSGPNGASNWGTSYSTCAGTRQSPIDLPGSSAFAEGVVTQIPSFDIDYKLDHTHEITFENHGKTVELVYHGKGEKLVNAGSLSNIIGRSTVTNNEYTLEQVHFHWGLTEDSGSEHSFDGTYYPLEMHLVHYNSAKYASIAQAVGHGDGLLVIGIMFQYIEDEKDDGSAVLDPLMDILLKENFTEHEEFETEHFSLADVLSLIDTSKFWLYPGGLTTPTCNEVVTWVVMKERISVTEDVIEAFQIAMKAEDTVIAPNFRPVQPLNGRIVCDSELQKCININGNNNATGGATSLKSGNSYWLFTTLICFVLAGVIV